jgi:hypothetical protein
LDKFWPHWSYIGAANVDPAPLIVPEPPDELAGVDDAGALDAPAPPELELELLLEPHAAIPSDAATVTATAPRRLVLNFFLLN